LKIAIDKNFPLVKIKDKYLNHTKSPWMTNGIFKSISKKNKLYEKFQIKSNQISNPTHKNETESIQKQTESRNKNRKKGLL
jgi:hypothetical protein